MTVGALSLQENCSVRPGHSYSELVAAADQRHRDRLLEAKAPLVDAQWAAAAAYNIAGSFRSATSDLKAAMAAAGSPQQWRKAWLSEREGLERGKTCPIQIPDPKLPDPTKVNPSPESIRDPNRSQS
jgi:hypothetical protein